MKRGYTLIELLVVVVIVLILIAATLPIAKRVMESSRPREASRQLAAHFSMARAYAARNNRPMGLWLECDAPVGSVDPTLRQCTRVYLAEVQPPYSGGTTGTRGTFRRESGQPSFVPLVTVNYLGTDSDMNGVPDAADADGDGRVDEDLAEKQLLFSLINDGEKFYVKLNHKGAYFECQRSGQQLLYLENNSSGAPMIPQGYDLGHFPGLPFQILRAPRRVGRPLELANGTCIDLEYSGMGTSGLHFGAATNRVVVMFAPRGSIERVYVDSGDSAPFGTLHFLIGRVDKVNPLPAAGLPFDADTSNLADANSLWVSVGRLNGSITSAENMPDAEHGASHPNPWSIAGRLEYLEECREAAIGREAMGGQ